MDPWQLMWTLAVTIFVVLKYLSLFHHPNLSPHPVTYIWVYAFCWVGLTPKPFNIRGNRINKPAWLIEGLGNLIFGVSLWCLATSLLQEESLVKGWCYCVAVVFILT